MVITGAVPAARTRTAIVDADVHNALPSPDALKPYLPACWHPYYDQGSNVGYKGHGAQVIGARPAAHFFRGDAVPASGVPGSDYELMREQLLDGLGVARAVLTPLDSIAFPQFGELGSALAAALNDWLVAEWLDRDERFSGVVSVPTEDGPAAAAEIERAAADPRFVAVLVPVQTREGLGHPKYLPILEAAAARGLPIVLHTGGFSGTHLATGYPTYMVEHHSGYAQVFHAQVASLVHSGVLDRLPGLQLVLEEGGVSWLPSHLWRLDRTWESMRAQAPHLERRPSEVVREHFWLTTQPLEQPERPAWLLDLLEQLDMNDRLLFATDYPHWDFDHPDRVLPASLIGTELREDVFRRNAERCFRFPR